MGVYEVLGLGEGTLVGFLVGFPGRGVGRAVGRMVGFWEAVGARVLVGVCVGGKVRDGFADGTLVGLRVGCPAPGVGMKEGLLEGPLVEALMAASRSMFSTG